MISLAKIFSNFFQKATWFHGFFSMFHPYLFTFYYFFYNAKALNPGPCLC
jgi:hypothetical protein